MGLLQKLIGKTSQFYSTKGCMFEKLEQLAKDNKKISDFHIRAGSPLAYRQTGEIIKVQEVMVTAQDLKDLLSMNCNEHELNKFEKTHELDTSVS